MSLSKDQQDQSYDSVMSFLRDGKNLCMTGGEIKCLLTVKNHQYDETITVNINHDAFIILKEPLQLFGINRPLWSSYFLFRWDEKESELLIDTTNYGVIRLKRKK